MSMSPKLFGTANLAIAEAGKALRFLGKELHAPRWQGIEAPAPMLEVLGISFRCPIEHNTSDWVEACRPNLPWADEHFEERVSGVPSNPGESYKNWPFYPKNERDEKIRPQQKFTHTYQERIWPKKAGDYEDTPWRPIRGIRYEYGDLIDVVALLQREPHTRQAFLPIWFPEDTGAVHGGRVPCTLGYLFMLRHQHLHCTYYIRSCDYFRHFRDDVYLAGRLVQWIAESLDKDIRPGLLDMHIGSLHCWLNERNVLPK